jgi:hypothetical protein
MWCWLLGSAALIHAPALVVAVVREVACFDVQVL